MERLKVKTTSKHVCIARQWRFIKRFVVTGIILFAWMISGSWGFTVHRTVNQLAVYELPKNLRNFFYVNMDYIVKQSVRPDLRRTEDSTEETKHFINLEIFGDSAAWKMPFVWEEAVRQYSRDSLLKHGYVPYHIITLKSLLTKAFRNRNKDSILFYAADLAHYVGDANVPLHTTINYDGQLTGQKGLHSLWETVIPEIQLDQFDLSSRHKAKYLKDPALAVWESIREAHMLIQDLLLQEKETTKEFTDSTKYRVQVRRGREVKSYTSQFAKAYNARLDATINRQLIHSANLIADFWYTCWVDAGKPDPVKISNSISELQKHTLQKELKAFRENRLLGEKLLIARQALNSSGQ